jgi:hypothetical protein
MKKLAFSSLGLLMLLMACKKSVQSETIEETQSQEQRITQRGCASHEVLQQQIAADPSLRARMDQIETFTKKAIASGEVGRLAADGVLEIPVVVHVLWNTTAQNINDLQVKSQIDVLNEDFQNTNADRTLLPANSFQSVASTGMKVRFVLAETINKYTKVQSWSSNDAMKNSRRGGSDAVDPANNLNIWVCNLGQGLLGYAQFPGGNLSTDGVVVLYSAFGSKTKYPAGTYTGRFDLGRTATHEVGHWMNLRHIWGDDSGACTGSDIVGDTPNQGGANTGVPTYPKISCNNGPTGDMFMNYMDYTDDRGMYMFSEGQKSRMVAVFASNGPRAAMGK